MTDKLRTGVLEAILNTLEISFEILLDQENDKHIICNNITGDSTYLNTEMFLFTSNFNWNLCSIKVTPTPSVFVNKWIDYSNKYGMGYQLTDSTVGVHFNDKTTLIMSPNGR